MLYLNIILVIKLLRNFSMIKENLELGAISKPRFEFRSFGPDFEEEHKLMSRLAVQDPNEFREKKSDDIYIVSFTNDTNNIKIRDGKIDVKTFVKEEEGFEQWSPLLMLEFPISAEILKNEIFPVFKEEMPEVTKSNYNIENFMIIINSHSKLESVQVKKHRFGYFVYDTICEVAEVIINGAKLMTISSESTDIENIKRTIKNIGIDQLENINYLEAVKRVIGMSDKPFIYESI